MTPLFIARHIAELIKATKMNIARKEFRAGLKTDLKE